jgi:cytochrome b pre-mRNA-processing protein 3
MLVVHLFLVLDRLRRCGSHGEEAAQILAETFITDMDDVMREMGIGDLSVARKMFQTAGAYMGRLKAYDDALEDPEPEVLVQALLRNVYADARPSEATLFARALAAYVRTSRDHLERQPTEDLLSGRVTFMQPDVAPAIAS